MTVSQPTKKKMKLHGVLKGLGMPYTIDFTDANQEAHKYAVKKLLEKFGPKGHCTLLDYTLFYAECLPSSEKRIGEVNA